MATVELSVFGLGSQVDVTSETLALAGVVGFTVAFEMGAHRLEHRLAGTPYMGMLAKIYKGKRDVLLCVIGVDRSWHCCLCQWPCFTVRAVVARGALGDILLCTGLVLGHLQ